MEWYKEILASALAQTDMTVTFKGCHIRPEKIVEMECYKALCEIEEILQDKRWKIRNVL